MIKKVSLISLVNQVIANLTLKESIQLAQILYNFQVFSIWHKTIFKKIYVLSVLNYINPIEDTDRRT